MKRLILRIFGEVQGVGFRFFALRQAQKLKLTGYVKNEKAGFVTIIAEGPEENLNELLDLCRQGPSYARVDKIEEMWDNSTGEFKEFKIE